MIEAAFAQINHVYELIRTHPALTVSLVSLAISILTFITNWKNKKGDISRNINDDFFDAIKEITAFRSTLDDLEKVAGEDFRSIENNEKRIRINTELDHLVSRADNLLKAGAKGNDVQFEIIAEILSKVGKVEEAAQKYRMAVDSSTSKLKEALNKRSYAKSLVLCGEVKKAKGQLAESISLLEKLKDTNEYDKSTMIIHATEARRRFVEALIQAEEKNEIKTYLDDFDRSIGSIREMKPKIQFVRAKAEFQLLANEILKPQTA